MTDRDQKIERVADLAKSAAKTAFSFLDMVGEVVEHDLFPRRTEHDTPPTEEVDDVPDARNDRLKLRCIPLGAPGKGSVTVPVNHYGELYVNTGNGGAEYHVEVVPGQPGKVTKITH